MKKILVVVFTAVFVMSNVSALFALDSSKVGVVDLFRALNESEAGQKAKTDLEGLIKSKQSILEEKGKRIESLRADLEKQSAILSPEAKKAKEDEIERLIRDYQRMVSDAQAEIKKKEGELTEEILKELRLTINSVAQEGGFILILEKAEGLILYSDKSIDITDRVIKKYNESKTLKK